MAPRPQGPNINPRKQLPEYWLWVRLTTLLITSKDVYPLHQPVNGFHEVLRLLIGKNSRFITSCNYRVPGERRWPRRAAFLSMTPAFQGPRPQWRPRGPRPSPKTGVSALVSRWVVKHGTGPPLQGWWLTKVRDWALSSRTGKRGKLWVPPPMGLFHTSLFAGTTSPLSHPHLHLCLTRLLVSA